MRRSTDRILVTHVGALPAPLEIWGATDMDETRQLEAVREVVGAQRRAGVDFVNEGELTKGGTWVQFITSRLQGFKPAETRGAADRMLLSSRDWVDFSDFYSKGLERGTLFEDSGEAPKSGSADSNRDWTCCGPVAYCGQRVLQREIRLLLESLDDVPAADAFLTSTAPMSLEVGRHNEFYKTDEEFLYALAEAMRVEYEAIAAAGLQIQIDDAWLAALWDRIGIPMGLAAYRRYCTLRVEALNHALRNIPESQIRYHLCWGSWHGPHSQDIPLPDIVDVMLSVKAQTYLFEAANVRHEHEACVWETVKLPEGKILAPGVVTHSTVLIEHPELVASRIQRFAGMVGRENVIASTDCGLGLRCHPQIAWAKLRALGDGAKLASQRLWARKVA
jgi:5-methyltetrahydropteroyltriglutamate--homocysteine methyltransferase